MSNNSVSGVTFGSVVAKVPKIKNTIDNKRVLVELRTMFKNNGTSIKQLSKDTLEFSNKNALDEKQADIWTKIFLNNLGAEASIKNDKRTFADKAQEVKILNNHLIGEEIFD